MDPQLAFGIAKRPHPPVAFSNKRDRPAAPIHRVMAVQQSRKEVKTQQKAAEDAPEIIEVKLKSGTLKVAQDTVPTGIFPLPRFLSRLLD